jgi:hypothetical protein
MAVKVVASVLGAFVLVALLHAQIPAGDRALIDDYLASVRSAESGGGSLENAFAKVTSVCRTLQRIDGNETVSDSLSEEEVQHLRTLPGIVVAGELNSASPDKQFFATLAQAHGTAADRQFFQTLNYVSPPDAWAMYLEGVSDFGACTRYGSGTLIEAYRRWDQFQKQYPGRYVQPSTSAVNDIAEELTHPLCACGNIASVTQELDSFVKAFPAAPLSARVSATARSIRADPSTVRTSCRPGQR